MAGEYERWMASGYGAVSDAWFLGTLKKVRRNGIAEPLRVLYAIINYGQQPFATKDVTSQAKVHRAEANAIIMNCVRQGLATEIPRDSYPELDKRVRLHAANERFADLIEANNQLDARIIASVVNFESGEPTGSEAVIERSVACASIGLGNGPVTTEGLSLLATANGMHPAAMLHDGLEALASARGIWLYRTKLHMINTLPEGL